MVCASVYIIHSSHVATSLNILEELADVPFSFSLNWMELLMSPNADSCELSSFPVYSRAWDQLCGVNCGSHSEWHAVGARYIC